MSACKFFSFVSRLMEVLDGDSLEAFPSARSRGKGNSYKFRATTSLQVRDVWVVVTLAKDLSFHYSIYSDKKAGDEHRYTFLKTKPIRASNR